MNTRNFAQRLVILTVFGLLAACGGGSSAPVVPPALAAITAQPAPQTITAGQNASFSVTAAGTALTYQWQHSMDGGSTFTDEAGATAATLTLTAVAQLHNGHFLRVVVSNSAGSVTSNAALLTVNVAPIAAAITTQPVSVTVVAPNAATFSAAATGTPSPTLQWQLSTNGVTSFADIAGATGSSYSTAATVVGDSGKQYRVVATNASGVATSNAATLTVNPTPVVPSFTTQPTNVTINAGQNAQFVVAAIGTPTPTLQWQLSTDNGINWSNITGETGIVFNVLGAALVNNGRQFRAVASNSSGSVNSNAGTLTVNAAAVTYTLSGTVSGLVAGASMVLQNNGADNLTVSTNGAFTFATLLSNGAAYNISILTPPAAQPCVPTYGAGTVSGVNVSNIHVICGPAFLGAFSPTGNSGTPHQVSSCTTTLLPNGKVLMAGGTTTTNAMVAAASLYDPATGIWAATGSMTGIRSGHTATLLPNGKVLVTGGYITTGVAATAELYDPATGLWTLTGSMVNARTHHTATLLPNGKVVVTGGLSAAIVNTVEQYDPATGLWSSTGGASVMFPARQGHTATLLPSGKLLVIGGSDSGGATNTAAVFDPATGSWATTGNMAVVRTSHTATLLPNSKVLVAGGVGTTGILASAELYDPATGTWTTTGSTVTGYRIYTATLLPNGKVLVTEIGAAGTLYLAPAELYDPATGLWTLTGSMTATLLADNATLLPNGKLLATGVGINAVTGVIFSTAELYW